MNSRRPIRHAFVVTGALLAAVAVPPLSGAAQAADTCSRYASATGSDTAAGTSAAPYRTVQKLVSSLTVGQSGCLGTGSYGGNVSLGTDGTTLRSVPGQRATLNTGTIEIRDGAEGVTVSDLNIVGGGGVLTMRPIGDRFTIARNDITNRNAGLSCILVGAQAATTTDGVIAGNKIHHCGKLGGTLDHGIYAQNFAPSVAGGTGLLIEDNLFYNLGAYSVQLYPNGTSGVVRHNVIDGAGGSVRGGIVIDGTVARNHRVEKNVISYTQTGGIVQRTGSGHVSLDNCFFSNSAGDVTGSGITRSGDINADPRFVSRSTADYRLATGSPCLTKVGYDTAAKIEAQSSAPSTTTTTAPVAGSAPSVAISSPTAGAVVGTDLHAVVTASDDRGVVKVELRIDGVLKATEAGAPYDQWLAGGSLSRGTHTFQARAYDADGLSTSVAVSFSRS